MKKNLSLPLLFLLLILFVFSCQPPVTFSEPQPPGKPDLESFPARLRGVFLSSDSSYYLSIDDQMVVKYGSYIDTMFQSRLDSMYFLDFDTLVNTLTGVKYPVSISGDSIFNRLNLRDTVFRISKGNLLRRWKGYCFINIRRGSAGWEVMRISLGKGILTLSSVGRKEDIEKLNDLTENPSDTILPQGYKINKKQLRAFVKGGGFEEQEMFIRIPIGDR